VIIYVAFGLHETLELIEIEKGARFFFVLALYAWIDASLVTMPGSSIVCYSWIFTVVASSRGTNGPAVLQESIE
jgi:hypothetical protein